MSESLRIALVAEGITDYEVLRAAIASILKGQSFNMKLLQPEESVAFSGAGAAGALGGGWRGVYKWTKQAVDRAGRLANDPLFLAYDVFVLHLDAGVADKDPAKDQFNPIPELNGVLPCDQPCPPPSDTTTRLRQVMLSWLGEPTTPPRTILCTPSKSIDAWVLAIFFPNDREMHRRGWECHPDPESRFSQQPKSVRFRKHRKDYQDRNVEIQEGWPQILEKLSEAKRFHDEFLAVLATMPK